MEHTGHNHRQTVRVWDMPTRLFHGALIGFMGLGWATAEGGALVFSLHLFSGVAVIALVGFRLLWGVIGTRHARFTDFVRSPRETRLYLKSMWALSPPRHLGHNPVGGWMVLGLLAVSFSVAATGLFSADDGLEGPLSSMVGRFWSHAMGNLHEGFAGLVGIFVAVHVLGVLAHSVITKENLILAMITGRKSSPGESIRENSLFVGLRALGVMGLIAALLWFLLASAVRADSDHERAYQALQSGAIRPLEDVLEKVEGLFEGRIVEVELEDDEDILVYEIKLLMTNGNVVELKIDARTLKIIAGHGTGLELLRKR